MIVHDVELLMAIRTAGGDDADLPFWKASREGQFLLHRCNACGRSYWPASRCIEHGDEAMAWFMASGRGEVHTYTVIHHAYTAAMHDRVPYVVAVVKLDEGPFFHTNIIGCDTGDVHVGMRVALSARAEVAGLALPVFKPENFSGH